MKTFIWNRECEVIAVNAETIEQARELAKPKLDELLDPNLEREKKRAKERLTMKLPDWIKEDREKEWRRDEEWWRINIEQVRDGIVEEKKILLREPDLIIEEGVAVIFEHMNQ